MVSECELVSVSNLHASGNLKIMAPAVTWLLPE